MKERSEEDEIHGNCPGSCPGGFGRGYLQYVSEHGTDCKRGEAGAVYLCLQPGRRLFAAPSHQYLRDLWGQASDCLSCGGKGYKRIFRLSAGRPGADYGASGQWISSGGCGRKDGVNYRRRHRDFPAFGTGETAERQERDRAGLPGSGVYEGSL